jgi:uncharacterized membrane protein
MFCNNCGKEAPGQAKFCDGCGASMPVEQGGSQMTVQSDAQDNNVIFMLSYLGILFFLPLVISPNSKAGRFHANQGLVLLITGIAGQIIISILSMILWKLWLLMSLVSTLWGLALLVFVILGMINAYKGEQKQLPVIGSVILIK